MQFALRSKASESSAYRADIDGLRAIAVLVVVFFHADVQGFSGGFTGVDIFFVISGFLIAGVIQKDLDRGTFSFAKFYDRRIRRILPALVAVLLTAAAIGAVLFPPQQFLDFGKSLLATVTFVSNIYFDRDSVGAGYFEPSTGVKLLLHTWSLAVEEQFYFVFPVLLIALTRFARHRTRIVLAVLAALSFALNLWLTPVHPVAAFYLLPGRAWELLLGALLAISPLPAPRHIATRSVTMLAGIAIIAYGVVHLTPESAFPGYNALFPCLGAALVLYAGRLPSPISRVLGCGPLVFIGAISYSLYLWHWPILAVARYYYVTNVLTFNQRLYPLIAALVLSVLSFELVETPFRSHRSSTPSSTIVSRGVLISAAVAALALVIVVTQGLPQRFRHGKRDLMSANYERKSEIVDIGLCANWRVRLDHYSDVHFCEVGHAQKNILFWGDSHITQLYPLLKDFQQTNQLHGHGIVFAAAGSCPPSQNFTLTWAGFHCNAFATYTMQRALKPDIDTVFIEFSPWWAMYDGPMCASSGDACAHAVTGPQAEQGVVNEMEGHIRTLQAAGKRVIVGLPFPVYNMSIPDFRIRETALAHLRTKAPWPLDLMRFVAWQQLQTVAERTHADIYAPRETLCPHEVCIYAVNGFSLYSDQSHFAYSQLWFIRDGLLKSLVSTPSQATLRPPPSPAGHPVSINP